MRKNSICSRGRFKFPVSFSEKAFKNLSEVKKFDYLLGMSMWMLTEERKNELLKQKDAKLHELDTLKKKTKEDLWREDLDAFMDKLDSVEEQERKDAEDVKPSKGKGGKAPVVSTFLCNF